MALMVTASQIHQWAASNREARSSLPRLIGKLIAESLPSEAIASKDFPSNVDHHGFDGVLKTERRHPYIPKGESAWEMSTNTNIGAKATADFNKRSQQAEQDASFIFVTPRNWPSKSRWLKSKQNGTWSEVRAYDASDLEQWLESAPNTTLWLSEQMGLPQQHIQSSQTFLRDWLNETDPAFPQSLILQDRDETKSKILDFVKQSRHNNSLTIFADTSDEALAFICATIDSTISLQSFVITNERGIDELPPWQRCFSQPYILAVRTSDLASKIPNNPMSHSLLLVAEARGSVPFNSADERFHSLQRVCNFHALDKFPEEIHVLEKRTGGSLSALHRQLNRNAGKRNPRWAQLSKGNRNFIWLALIGGWDERHDADKEIISELSEAASFKDWHEFTDSLLEGEDAPLSRTREDKPQYKLFSRIDAFLTISQKIRGDEIDRLIKKIQKVYLEDDPNYHLPNEEVPHFHEKRKYSDALRRGIMDGLAILVCYSERGNLACNNVAPKIKAFFDNMFADDRAWSKLRDILPELTEISPHYFILQLRKTLKESPEKIVDLFAPRGSLNWDNNYLHPPLLWAMERLAWHPDRLGPVLKLLCQLQKDCEGNIKSNFMNRPSKSMISILRPWMPQTSANINQRIEALCNAYETYPDEVVKLALALAKRNGMGIPTHAPIWRDDVLAKPETTDQDRIAMIIKAIDLIMDYLQNKSHPLADRVEIAYQVMNNFQWWGIEKSQEVADVICKIPTNNDTYNRKLFEWASEWMRRCSSRSKNGRYKRKFIGTYKKLRDHFEPYNLAERYAHLFSASAGTEFYRSGEPYEKYEARANEARNKALLEIYEKGNIAGLLELLKRAEAPDIVAVSLYASHITKGKFPHIDEYLAVVLDANLNTQDADSNILAKRLHLSFIFYGAPPSEPMNADAAITVIDPVLKRAADTSKKALLLQAIRIDQQEGRDFIDRQPDDVKRQLFSHIWIAKCHGLYPQGEDKIIPPESAWLVDHYLQYKRPRLALASFRVPYHHIPAERQLRLLSAIFVSDCDVGSDKDPMPESYCIEQMFESLAEQYAETDIDTLAQLSMIEMRFHNRLSHSEYLKSGGFILRHLANSPAYFIELHKYVYKDEDGNIPELNIPKVNIEVYARVAYDVFYSLNLRHPSHLPWVNKNHTLDDEKLRVWIRKVRQLAKEAKMSKIIDQHIGKGLSHSRLSRSDLRPEYAVCDIIKDNGSPDMYEGFRMGRYNSRGVMIAGVDDMGFSSISLSDAYSIAADKLRDKYPDMAGIFDKLSDSYQRDATHWRHEEERMDMDSR